eukprot:1253012-Rhodomonas_salina.5
MRTRYFHRQSQALALPRTCMHPRRHISLTLRILTLARPTTYTNARTTRPEARDGFLVAPGSRALAVRRWACRRFSLLVLRHSAISISTLAVVRELVPEPRSR